MRPTQNHLQNRAVDSPTFLLSLRDRRLAPNCCSRHMHTNTHHPQLVLEQSRQLYKNRCSLCGKGTYCASIVQTLSSSTLLGRRTVPNRFGEIQPRSASRPWSTACRDPRCRALMSHRKSRASVDRTLSPISHSVETGR